MVLVHGSKALYLVIANERKANNETPFAFFEPSEQFFTHFNYNIHVPYDIPSYHKHFYTVK